MMRAAALLIVALAFPAAAHGAPSRLRVVDLSTGAISAQADARTWGGVVWRPDGSVLAVSGNTVRALPGGTVARVRGALGLSLSPAGERLAVRRPDERIEVRTLAGRVLGRHRVRGSTSDLAWSRDGRRLAVSWYDDDLRDHLTVLGARARVIRTFDVPDEALISPAGWAPDGRSLAFVNTPDAFAWGSAPVPRELRRLDLATGAQTVLLRGDRCQTTGLGGVCELLDPPAFAPDGTRIAFVRNLNAVTLLGTALPTELRPTAHCDGVFDVAWGPDGTWLLVAYVENGSMRLAQVPIGTMFGIPRLIADLGHTDVNGLTVSPDGTRAAFSGDSDIDF